MEWMLMPLKRYAEFSGRSRRKEYWMFALGLILLEIILFVVMGVVGGVSVAAMGADRSGGAAMGMLAGMGLFGIVFGLIMLALIIPSLAVGVRRLHDTDRSGWWLAAPIGLAILYVIAGQISSAVGLIFGLAYLAAGIALFVFTVLPGTVGPNRFGEDPKGAASSEVFA